LQMVPHQVGDISVIFQNDDCLLHFRVPEAFV
jgi:hypothetical protein